tara:strand:+ start:14027 stop:15046 length:1020 start_codon:yes stop_codon:yes gene_type:complete
MVSVLPVLILAAPFIAVAHLTAWLSKRLEPEHALWGDLIKFDEQFGWKPTPSMNSWHLVDDVFKTTTDEDGCRGAGSIDEAEMIVVGDSFAWGYGVSDQDFFANLDNTPKTKAIGCVGYNQIQQLMWMREIGPRLSGKTVVWFVYLGNDLYDNLQPHMNGYRTPFVRQSRGGGPWEIVASHVSPQRWFFKTEALTGSDHYLEQASELCVDNHFSRRAYSACEFLLGEAKALCDESGADLVIASIPEKIHYDVDRLRSQLAEHPCGGDAIDPDYPDRRLNDMCERLGVPFVATKQLTTIDDFKASDCHWNERGHARIAQLLKDLHRNANRVQPPREHSNL